MKYTKEHIEKLIINIVYKVTGKSITTSKISLLDENLQILDADFIYIFSELEKELNLPIFNIFQHNNFEIMYISNLSDAILQLYSDQYETCHS